MSDEKIKVGIGEMTIVAANLDEPHVAAMRAVEQGKGWIRGTRAQLLAILYYIEAVPAFWTPDGQDKTERSAVRRTSKAWREKLGLKPNDPLPVPAAANEPLPIPMKVHGPQSATLCAALEEHTKRYSGQLLTPGTFASEEFDRLYLAWTRARWDEGHAWTRSVWKVRP